MIDPTMTLDESDRFLVVNIRATRGGWFLWWLSKPDEHSEAQRYRVDLAQEYTFAEIEHGCIRLDDGINTMAIPKKLVENRIVRVIPKRQRKALVSALEPIQSDIDAGRIERVLILSEHNAFDGHVMFWCEDGKGYTSSIDAAWKCTWERAYDITRNGTYPIPFEVAERFVVRAVKLTEGIIRELRDASVLLRARQVAATAKDQTMRIAHPQERRVDDANSAA